MNSNAEPGKRKYPRLRPLPVLAVGLAILLAAFYFTAQVRQLKNGGYVSVYVDVNPSLELVVSRSGKITDVKYLNVDAQTAFCDLELVGVGLLDGIDAVMERLYEKGYFENGEMTLSVENKNDEFCADLLGSALARAMSIKELYGYDVTVEGQLILKTDAEAALGNHMSPAKYTTIVKILEKDRSGTYGFDELAGKNIGELKRILRDIIE